MTGWAQLTHGPRRGACSVDRRRDVIVLQPGIPGVDELLGRHGAALGPLDAGLGIWDHGEAQVIGAAIFNNYDFASMELTVIFDRPIALTRGMLNAVFSYPFIQLDRARLTARTRANNAQVRRKIRRLGFKPEGRLRRYFGDDDAMIYGMLKDECKWIQANG